MNLRHFGVLGCLLLSLCACRGVRGIVPDIGQEADSFLPPTLAASASPLEVFVTPDSQPVAPTAVVLPTPACTNLLTFLEDLTIPDGSVVRPGELLDKRWLVQNNGTCNWDERYRVKLESGDSLGAPEEQALYPARSGSQAVIRMLFTAPEAPGVQRSSWQAYSPEGEAFGDPFFIEIVVESPSP